MPEEYLNAKKMEKLERIKSRGINPYPSTFHPSHTSAQAVALLVEIETQENHLKEVLKLAGRIMTRRDMGKISFMDIRDGSGKMQIFFRQNDLDEASIELLKDLDLGDFIGVEGSLMRTRTGEPSLAATKVSMLSKSLLPLPEKWHGLQDVEKRYRQRYLDLISNADARQTFLTRSRVISVIRAFMNAKGFLEVETPVLQPEAGGALARPFITHHQALNCDFYMRIALELHLKRLIVGGFDRVYEIGRIFRNEGVSTRHNPEFTMMESYQAYANYKDVMDFLEEMVSSVVKEISGGYTLPFGDITLDFTPPWPRLTMRDAVKQYAGIDFFDFPTKEALAAEMTRRKLKVDPAKDWGKLVDELVGEFVEPHLVQPTFLTDHPVAMSPLAKQKPEDPRLTERFEAICANMEIANAFSELNDPVEQRARFKEQLEKRSQLRTDESESVDEDFLAALAYGMPPTGGLGVGIDRLVMLFTNHDSIREVILFPALKDREDTKTQE
ncbi:lysine--tRNA ligase [Dehalococcoides mccartyi]|jgi:lysyl-tRNA synthetase class 2|uniref:lysine--tRNA ligase n=1 Tax=Dehalococcoides mccartyi TaxID=61435 RepID=UPI00099CE533|nr:lysine--tRNA ligase [Dehalococcoides mccartyi]AQX74390.1 lysine--tRNA ligase [Dehalococcoides mccartyi]AQY72967.1 lysine--tRNA ligase [Dehalococcoides mccartyi]